MHLSSVKADTAKEAVRPKEWTFLCCFTQKIPPRFYLSTGVAGAAAFASRLGCDSWFRTEAASESRAWFWISSTKIWQAALAIFHPQKRENLAQPSILGASWGEVIQEELFWKEFGLIRVRKLTTTPAGSKAPHSAPDIKDPDSTRFLSMCLVLSIEVIPLI